MHLVGAALDQRSPLEVGDDHTGGLRRQQRNARDVRIGLAWICLQHRHHGELRRRDAEIGQRTVESEPIGCSRLFRLAAWRASRAGFLVARSKAWCCGMVGFTDPEQDSMPQRAPRRFMSMRQPMLPCSRQRRATAAYTIWRRMMAPSRARKRSNNWAGQPTGGLKTREANLCALPDNPAEMPFTSGGRVPDLKHVAPVAHAQKHRRQRSAELG